MPNASVAAIMVAGRDCPLSRRLSSGGLIKAAEPQGSELRLTGLVGTPLTALLGQLRALQRRGHGAKSRNDRDYHPQHHIHKWPTGPLLHSFVNLDSLPWLNPERHSPR